ncbi:MAG: bactofilin family protein [Candidatus Binatia bacterium]
MALWTEPTQKEPFDAKGERPEQQKEASTHLVESVFAPGLTIEGKIEGAGNVRIAGRFKGDIDVNGDLNIEKGAHITGKLNAHTVTIEGELEGNVVASAQVKLMESGQVIGELKARTLTVVAGSRMRGTVDFGWDDSPAAKRDAAADKRPKEAPKVIAESQAKP